MLKRRALTNREVGGVQWWGDGKGEKKRPRFTKSGKGLLGKTRDVRTEALIAPSRPSRGVDLALTPLNHLSASHRADCELLGIVYACFHSDLG